MFWSSIWGLKNAILTWILSLGIRSVCTSRVSQSVLLHQVCFQQCQIHNKTTSLQDMFSLISDLLNLLTFSVSRLSLWKTIQIAIFLIYNLFYLRFWSWVCVQELFPHFILLHFCTFSGLPTNRYIKKYLIL